MNITQSILGYHLSPQFHVHGNRTDSARTYFHITISHLLLENYALTERQSNPNDFHNRNAKNNNTNQRHHIMFEVNIPFRRASLGEDGCIIDT